MYYVICLTAPATQTPELIHQQVGHSGCHIISDWLRLMGSLSAKYQRPLFLLFNRSLSKLCFVSICGYNEFLSECSLIYWWGFFYLLRVFYLQSTGVQHLPTPVSYCLSMIQSPKHYFSFTNENNDRLFFTLGNRQVSLFQIRVIKKM